MFHLYIMYTFIGAKVNHTISKDAGQKDTKPNLVRANNLHKVHYSLFCHAPSLESANCPSALF